MKGGKKETALKVVIVTAFSWVIATVILPIVLSIIFEKYMDVVMVITYTLIIGAFVLGAILLFMICFMKIKITPAKVKAERYRLAVETFDDVKAVLVAAFTSDGFSQPVGIQADYADNVTLLTKTGFDKLMVLEIVRVNELTDDILEKCTDAFWDYVCSQEMQSRDVSLIQCICVDRITKTFSKFTDKNVPQQFGRYQLPVGISFGGKTVYIATQKGGLFKAKYKKLKKLFLRLTEQLMKPIETQTQQPQ